MKCPKCGHLRKVKNDQKDDLFRPDECPACGIIYAKYATGIKSKPRFENECDFQGATEFVSNTFSEPSTENTIDEPKARYKTRIKKLLKHTMIAGIAFWFPVIFIAMAGIQGLSLIVGLAIFFWFFFIRPLKNKKNAIAKVETEKSEQLKNRIEEIKVLAKVVDGVDESFSDQTRSTQAKLIDCPDCNEKVSYRASICPACGCPIKEVLERQREVSELQIPPKFPEELSVGPLLFVNQNSFASNILEKGSSIRNVFPGKKIVFLHVNGIVIDNLNGSVPYPIHYSKIIDATYSDQSEILPDSITQSKSMAGRVVGGAILFGPVGALIGAISATNTSVNYDPHYLTIRFWDWDSTGEPKTHFIVFGDNYSKIKIFKRFADKINMEKDKWASEIE